MFAAFGGERWWPLNSGVSVMRTDPEALVALLDRHGRGVRGRFPSLDAAVEALAPYPFGRSFVQFVMPTADGSALTMSSEAPTGSMHGAAGLARQVVHCDCITAKWAPEHRKMLASAGFDDYRDTAPPDAAPSRPGRSWDQLTVQVSDQGGRFVLSRIPPGPGHPERDYEEPSHYAARRVADRLPFELLRRYVAAVGIPVDDPGYLAGPVLTVSSAARPSAERMWTTMAELRAAAGYPAHGIPTDLRERPVLDDGDQS